MYLDADGIALATRCLWSLQEAAPEVDGLIFTHVDGLTLTSTLSGDDVTERLAAIATALFLLGEQVSEAWQRGESLAVAIQLRVPGDETGRVVSLKPVGYAGVLTGVYRLTPQAPVLERDLLLAAQYLETLLAGGSAPPPEIWHTR